MPVANLTSASFHAAWLSDTESVEPAEQPTTTATAKTLSSLRIMTTTVLHIEGMTCQNCVRHVTEALTAVDGVQSVVVSLEHKTADLTSAVAPSNEALRLAIEEAGYSLRA